MNSALQALLRGFWSILGGIPGLVGIAITGAVAYVTFAPTPLIFTGTLPQEVPQNGNYNVRVSLFDRNDFSKPVLVKTFENTEVKDGQYSVSFTPSWFEAPFKSNAQVCVDTVNTTASERVIDGVTDCNVKSQDNIATVENSTNIFNKTSCTRKIVEQAGLFRWDRFFGRIPEQTRVAQLCDAVEANETSAGLVPVTRVLAGEPITGPKGDKGDKGDTGARGEAGPTPIPGNTARGATGAQGPIGLTGPAGSTGLTGITGLQGPIGLTGLTGLTGAQGIQGIQGTPGVLSITNGTNVTGTLVGTNLVLGWTGTLVPTLGGTGLTSTTPGSILTGGAGNTINQLNPGTTGQVLTIIGGTPTWINPVAGFADPLTTAGDLMFRDGTNTTTRLPVGTTSQVLSVVGGLPTYTTPTVTAANVTGAGNLTPASSKVSIGNGTGTTLLNTTVDVNEAALSLQNIGGALSSAQQANILLQNLGGALSPAQQAAIQLSNLSGSLSPAQQAGILLQNLGGALSTTQQNAINFSNLAGTVNLATQTSGVLPLTSGGTGATTASGARTNLGLGTIATQNSNAIVITGGTIDGTLIGSTTPSTGVFTNLTSTGITALNTTGANPTTIGNPLSTTTIGGPLVTTGPNTLSGGTTINGPLTLDPAALSSLSWIASDGANTQSVGPGQTLSYGVGPSGNLSVVVSPTRQVKYDIVGSPTFSGLAVTGNTSLNNLSTAGSVTTAGTTTTNGLINTGTTTNTGAVTNNGGTTTTGGTVTDNLAVSGTTTTGGLTTNGTSSLTGPTTINTTGTAPTTIGNPLSTTTIAGPLVTSGAVTNNGLTTLNGGLVSTGTNSFSGASTFSGPVTFTTLPNLPNGDLVAGTGISFPSGVATSRLLGTGNLTVAVNEAGLSLQNIGGALNLATQTTGTLPVANGGTGLTSVGTAGQVLTSNGTTLSYQTPTVAAANITGLITNAQLANSTIGTTTGTTGTAPAFTSTSTALGGTTQLNIPLASGVGVTSGTISNTDYTTFLGKQNALTFGSYTTPNPAITIANGANSTVGPNVTIDIANASTTQTGLLTAADFTAFNNKVSSASGTAGQIVNTGTTQNPIFGLPTLLTTGTAGSATQVPVITYDAQGRITGVTNTTITPLASSITGAGTLSAASTKVTVGNGVGTTLLNTTVDVNEANLNLANIGGALSVAQQGAINLTNVAGTVNLATQVAGTLPTTNGGTGLTIVGTAGQVLTSNGTILSYITPSVTAANVTGGASLTSTTPGLSITGVNNLLSAGTINYVIPAGSITGSQLANNTITNAQLAPNSVNSSNIVDGTVGLADLAQGTCGPNQYLQQNGAGTAWICTTLNLPAAPVTSVFGRVGIVTAQAGDYTTTQVTEGTNLYFTNARAIAAPLTGFAPLAGTVTATDSILQAIQKLQGTNTAQDVTIAGKQNALTFGSYTTPNSAITITNGANSTVGPNVTIDIVNATGLVPGLLTAANFNTFNNSVDSVSGTAGQILSTGGQTPVLSLANVGTAGSYGSATQVPVFTTDAQGRVTGVTNTTITPAASSITGGQALTSPLSTVTLGGTSATALLQGVTVDVNQANLSLNSIGGTLGTAKGGTGLTTVGTAGQVLTSNGTTLSYTTPSVTASNVTGGASFTTSTPGVTIAGVNNLLSAGNINIQNATSAQPGLLTAADWTTFNNSVDSVIAGTGLANSGTASALNLNVVYGTTAGTALQGSLVPLAPCPGFSKLVWTGTAFACSPDQDTIYTAGSGIAISGTNVISNAGVLTATAGTGITNTGTVTAPIFGTTYGTTAGTSLQGNTVPLAPCPGSSKLVWTGTAFACSPDQDTLYSAGTGLTLTGTTFSLPSLITAGTGGSATTTPVITYDAQGRITAVTNTTITPAASSITGAQNLTAASTKVSVTGGTGATLIATTVDVNEANLALNNIGGTLGTAKGGTGLTTVGTAGQVLTSNGTTLSYTTPTVAATNITGTITNAQLANSTYGTTTGTTGLAPAFTSTVTALGGTTQLNIPLASGVGVTSGTISKAEYDIFNNSVDSVLGTAAQILSTGGQNPVLSLANVGIAGTYGSTTQTPVFTTDAQGRVINVTNTTITPAASNITGGQPLSAGTGLSIGGAASAALLLPATISLDVLTTGVTATTSSNSGLETDASGLKLLGGCANGQVLKWVTPANTWTCSADIGGTAANLTAGSTKVTVTGGTNAVLVATSVDVNEANLTLNNIGGTLGVTKGGTGLTTVGTAGQVLTSNGTTLSYTTPTVAAANITGTISNSQLANSTYGTTTGTTGLAPAFSSTSTALGGTTQLNIPLASGVGVTSGTISNTDYAIFLAKESALTFTGNSLFSRTANTITGATCATTGQVLAWNGAAFACSTPTTGTVTSVSGTAGQILSTGGATPILSLASVGTAGTYGSATQVPVFTTDAQGRVTGVTNTTITPAASSVTGGASLTTTTTGLTVTGTNNLLSAATVNYSLATGIAGLTAGAQGTLGGTGTANTYVGADGLLHLLPNAAAATTNVLTSAGGNVTSTVNGISSGAVAISGLTTTNLSATAGILNSQLANSTYGTTTGTTGLAPAFSAASTALGGTVQLNIPLASGAGVTSGTISKAEYDAFVAKVASVTAGTGISVTGTATAPIINNTGLLSIATSTGTTGLVLTPTTTAGAVTQVLSGTLAVANGGTGVTALSNVLGGNGVAITNGTGRVIGGNVTVDITLPTATDALSATTSSGSGLEKLASGLTLLQGCADGQILKWNETTDVWACQNDNGSVITPANVTAGSTKVTLGGTPTGAALQAFSVDVNEANLTLNNIGGTLGTTKGGTGLTTIGTANQVLAVNGTGTGLVYVTPNAGTVTSVTTPSANSGITIGGTAAAPTVAVSGLTATACNNSTQKLIWNGSTFSCGVDTDTTYTAGTGISLTGTVFANTGVLSVLGTAGQIVSTGGQNPTLSLPTLVVAGTGGSATQVPVFTYDAQGRITGVTNTTITPAASSITGAGNLTTTTTGLTIGTGTGATLINSTVNYNLATGIAGLTAGAQGTLGGTGTANTYVGADGLLHLLPNASTALTLAAVGAVPNANGATLTGTVLNLQPANVTNPGVVTTTVQEFAGNKSFTGLTKLGGAGVAGYGAEIVGSGGAWTTASWQKTLKVGVDGSSGAIIFPFSTINTTQMGIGSTNDGWLRTIRSNAADNTGTATYDLQINNIGNFGLGNITPSAFANEKVLIAAGVANNSGLRFNNLIAASPGVAGNGKVLGLDTTGNVIYVNDAGVGSATSLGAVGTTPNANGATLTAGVLNLEPATITTPGVVTTTTQSFAGLKAFVNNTGTDFKSAVATGDILTLLANQSGAASFNGILTTTDLTAARTYTLPDASGTICLTNTCVSSLGAPTGTNANGGAITAGVLNLSFADATNPGIVSTTTQTFAGNKTLNNNLNVNGNTVIGDAVSDTLTITAATKINGSEQVNCSPITDASSLTIGAPDIDTTTCINIIKTTANQTVVLPTPTTTTQGKILYVSNTGTVGFTALGSRVEAGATRQAFWTGTAWVWLDGSASSDVIKKTLSADFSTTTPATPAVTVPVSIPDWTWPVTAGETWAFVSYPVVSVGANSKFNVSIPGGGTNCNFGLGEYSTGSKNSTVTCTAINEPTAVPSVAQFYGSFKVTTTGSASIQFAQNAVSTLGTIRAGSYMVAYRVSGADLAEIYYDKSGLTQPGNIIELTGEGPSQIALSTLANREKSFGIVSTKPGQVLGEADGNGKPTEVALVGRVPVKVTTKNGAIKAGDQITVSDIPGVGQLATTSGRVVGKALNSYSGTEIGEVTVFVEPGFWQAPVTINLDSIFASFRSQALTPITTPKESEVAKVLDLAKVTEVKDTYNSFDQKAVDTIVGGFQIQQTQIEELKKQIELLKAPVIVKPQAEIIPTGKAVTSEEALTFLTKLTVINDDSTKQVFVLNYGKVLKEGELTGYFVTAIQEQSKQIKSLSPVSISGLEIDVKSIKDSWFKDIPEIKTRLDAIEAKNVEQDKSIEALQKAKDIQDATILDLKKKLEDLIPVPSILPSPVVK
jgi:collagen type VII alpha